MKRLSPGATIGILGSGQLGRMTSMAARRMGFAVHIFSPDSNSPAEQVTDRVTIASYEDTEALKAFAAAVDVISLEFENIPVSSVAFLAQHTDVFPRAQHLAIIQDRVKEKSSLQAKGIPVTPFKPVADPADLAAAVKEFNTDIILKTCRFGYDGKGQRVVPQGADVAAEFAALGSDHLIAEKKIDLVGELSVLVSRNSAREIGVLGPFENEHAGGILDISVYPASFSSAVCDRAVSLARELVEQIDYYGILCIELFLDASGDLFVNELAPRPHNSGHLTIEAFHTSQFEMHVRAICNLPPGSSDAKCCAAMVNLLGDRWQNAVYSPAALGTVPEAALHLYGKAEAKPGRKMGHATVCGTSVDAVRQAAVDFRSALFQPMS